MMHGASTTLGSNPFAEELLAGARIIAISTTALGLAVLCGWALDISALQHLLPGLVSMKANTAAAFVLSGMCLYLHTLRQTLPTILLARRMAAALVLLLGLVTLSEYYLGWNAGIDQLLFSEHQGTILTSHPGRMSSITAANFVLTGSALLLMEARLWMAVQVTAFAVATSALLPLGSYMFGNLALIRIGNTTAIAAHTVAGFLMLSAGILLATQNHALMVRLQKKSLMVGLATSLATLVLILGAAFYNFVQKDRTSQWVEHTYEVIQGMESFSNSLHDFLYHNRGFLLTGDDRQLLERDKGRDTMLAELSKVHQMTSHDAVQQERLAMLDKLVRQRMERAEFVVQIRREKGIAAAAAMLASGQGDTLTDEIEAKLDELEGTEKDLLKEQQKIAEVMRSSSLFTLSTLATISMLLLLWVFRTSQREVAERRQREQELQKFKAIIDSTDDAVISKTLNGIIQSWNRGAEKIFGYTAEEAIGKPMQLLVPPNRLDEEPEILSHIMRGEKVDHFETVRLRKDGRPINISATISPILDSRNVVIGASKIARDITDSKWAEEALRKSEEQFRAIFENAAIGIARISTTGRFLEINEEFCRIIGYTHNEVLSQEFTFQQITFPEDLDPDLIQVNKLLNGDGDDYTMEKRYIRKDGGIAWVNFSVHLLRGSDRNPLYFISAVQDITERKLAENELREKEERLALATLHNGVGVWDWNLVTQEMIWDDSMFALYHIRREDFTGTEWAWRAALHPDDLHRSDREVDDAIADIRPFDTEFRVVWPSGEVRHIKAVAKVFRDERGTPLRMLGINMDVTDRRRSEEALLKSEANLRAMLDNAPYLVWLKDTESRYITINKVFANYLQLKDIRQVEGKTDMDLHPIEMAEKYRADDAEVMASRQQKHIEEPAFDGSRIHWVETYKTPIIDAYGNVRGTVGFASDISARKLRENIQMARLRLTDYATRHSLKELLVATLDEACALTGSSVGFYHFLDTDQQTLSLQAWSTRTTQEFCKAAGEGAHYSIDQAGVWVDCVRERRPVIHNDYAALPHKRGMPPGHAHVEREMVVPIFRNELIVAILGVGNKTAPYNDSDLDSVTQLADLAWDIAVAKRASEEVHRLNAELEQRVMERTAQLEAANRDMEGFSYSVSHDLRAPLRAIDGFSRILLEDYAASLDTEGRRLLNIVGDNAQKMGELIDDILAFSRTTRNKVTRSEINMDELVREVMEELKPSIAGRELKLELKALPPARADRSMLHQVLFNLLGNAIKFTQHKAPALIEIGAYGENKETVYYVKDNGVGFDMQYVDKLFGVFQRLHGQDEFEGTGIGLAIVKRIIAKHGGRVWAEGKVGEGATVYFSLPAEEKGHA